MKKKLITSICIVLIVIFITTIVQAVNIELTLPQDFKQTNLQTQSNIALYATNEEKDESVVVSYQENELTGKVINLNQLNEESFNAFVEKYNQAKVQEGQVVLRQEKYVKDDMVFIDTVFEYTEDNKKIQTEEYYTIIDETAITISMSFLQKQVDSLKVREIINSISMVNDSKMDLEFLVLPAVLVILGIIYFIKQRKNKVQLNDTEKKKVLKNIIEYMSKIDYSKFSGVLILFAVTIGLNIINLFFGIVEVITRQIWSARV